MIRRRTLIVMVASPPNQLLERIIENLYRLIVMVASPPNQLLERIIENLYRPIAYPS